MRIFKRYPQLACLLPALVLIIHPSFQLNAQETTRTGTIEGIVYDENYNPVPFVSIGTLGTIKPYGTQSDADGYFKFEMPSGRAITLRASHIGYDTKSVIVSLKQNETKMLNIILSSKESLMDVVTVTASERGSTVHIDPIVTQAIPGIQGGVEAVLMTLPGVRSNNELSSQYSVRGGNIDENLVYINGIEVYRPFLTRSGQQEGLSIVNTDLVSSVQFSSGGFDAKFGDKMSSVLDIKYKEPTETFSGSISGHFMGGSMHLEGITPNKKFSYLLGLRHKATSYVLKKMEEKGNYKPSFTDFQGLLRYKINEKHSIDLFGNIAYNIYNFVPTTRKTTFGSSGDPKEFWVAFKGREHDKFESYMASLSWTYNPNENRSHKFIFSFFNTKENENYDIDSRYELSEVSIADNTVIKGEILGIGHNLTHARNALNGIFSSLDYQGEHIANSILWQWGARYQYQDMLDMLNEWSLVDSSDYAVPGPPYSTIGDTGEISPYPPILQDIYRSNNHYFAHFIQAYGQARFNFNKGNMYDLCVGVRTFYSSYNNEFVVSPRINFTYRPLLKGRPVFRFAVGHYAQPPLYKEYRDVYGNVHPDVKAQKSIHILAGNDVFINIWNRPFKITTDIYYKYHYDLNPYEIDNISLRYMASNSSKGHTGGLDFRFSGEFVEGVESWFSLSFLKTSENITYTGIDGLKHSSGWTPRPTDQLFAVNVFFQDYLTKRKNFKVFLNLIFATGLPSGSKDRLEDPSLLQYRGRLRMPAYKRVDVGMSFLLMRGEKISNVKNPLRYLKNVWLGIEVLNIFQMNNTISYTWIKTLDGNSYSIPNRLTPLQLNAKLEIKF